MKAITISQAMTALEDAMSRLESAGWDADRLEPIKYELFKAWGRSQGRYFGSIRHCYLAFYGAGGDAKYVKVGISRDPKRRIKDFSTGNPLRVQWAYAAEVGCARDVELELHRHLAASRSQGEWFSLDEMSEQQVDDFVTELAQVAAKAAGSPVIFHRI